MKETISVIVPVYKVEDYIGICIESIVNQTYKDLEIILVDDGSPDECPKICDQWSERDKRIVVIHKKNGGLVSARKAGMQAATGKYIGYVDGDDWIEPDMYEKMLQIMCSEKVDVVITGFQKELFGKNINCYNAIGEGVYSKDKMIQEVFPKMIWDVESSQCGVFTYVWNKLFKRENAFQYQMAVEEQIIIGEDAACVYPIILNSEAIAITKLTGYHYRQRMDSLLRKTTNSSENISKLKMFYKYMQGLYYHQNLRNMIQEQLYHFYINNLLMMSDNLVLLHSDLGDGFPFINVKEGSRIVIYSAGAYGIHVYKQFSRSPKFEVVSWTDPDYEQYEKSEFEVVSLKCALSKKYDFVIIASIDKVYISQAEKELKCHGVDADKIVSVKQNYSAAIDWLKRKGYLMEIVS